MPADPSDITRMQDHSHDSFLRLKYRILRAKLAAIQVEPTQPAATMCLQCPRIKASTFDPHGCPIIPKAILDCLMRQFSFDRLTQLCDQYVRQKAKIWTEYDTIIEVLDAEAKVVPDRVKAEMAELKTSWIKAWDGVSVRRGRRPGDCWLKFRMDQTLKVLRNHGIKSVPVCQVKEREWAEKSRNMAIQSLDDEYIALLEAERMKREGVYQAFDKLSLACDKKTEAGLFD